ncbi:MAG: amidohydrolase family protein [Gammaproteobacteria bacterium]|nr:amidohydrolase family protein [Gammaproteobacteria bacterium]
MIRSICTALAGIFAFTAAAGAEVTVIRGAKVHTLAAAGTLEDATLVLRDGRIERIGRNLAIPAGATVIEAAGKVVTPGLIDAYGRLGIVEIDAEEGSVDTGAKNLPYSAAFSIADAIDPRSVRIEVNRAEGITRALVAPAAVQGADGIAPVIAGQAAFIHLGRGNDLVVKSPAGFVFTYGETGAQYSGGARSAALLRLRELLEDARDYARNRKAFDQGSRREYAGTRLDLDALQPLLAGKVPLLAEVHRASDIRAVMRLASEFALKLVIIGGAEAWRVAGELATAKVPVVIDVFDNLPSRFETLGATFDNAARLDAAGVEVAFAYSEHYNPRNARQLAGNAVAHGLRYEAALAALTRVPARIYGVGASEGTLEPGKVADLVIWDGDPLETTTMAERVFVAGEAMPTSSRQTQLRDRYRRPGGPLPQGYAKP